MRVSQCVFYTGRESCHIPDRAAARDAVDELFTHSDGISEQFLKELDGLGVRLPRPPIRVVTITPGPGGVAFTLAEAERFAAEMAQILPQKLPADGLFYYINSRIQGIVSAGDQQETAELYQALKGLVAAYEGMQRPHVAISNVYGGLRWISHGCEENQEARLFERFLEKPIDVVVQPKDFFLYGSELPQEDDDSFFGDVSQKICNAMVVGDRPRMHSVLDTALDYMVSRFPRVSGVHMRAIHFCKPLEMSLVGADLIDRLFIQQFRLVQKIIETDNEVALRAAFHAQMDQIWDYSMERKQLRHGELMHRVVEYMERNLHDSKLSILTIAENFNMPEAKLSAAFRQYYQESIPNFIHQRRVAYIKSQLRTTQTPIRTIALDAGYISIATMNRAFLRLEGMYPGQYRKRYPQLQDGGDV